MQKMAIPKRNSTEEFHYNLLEQLKTKHISLHNRRMYTLIVIGASDRTRDVTRYHCNHGSSQESGTCILHTQILSVII